MIKVLAAIPYVDHRLFDQTIDCALSLDIPEGCTVNYMFQRGNGHDNDLPCKAERIVRKRNEARRAAIDGDYDYLFFIDADVVFHPDTLSRLLWTAETYKPAVTYGLFCVRKPPYWWACSIHMEYKGESAIHYTLWSDKSAARSMFNEPALHTAGFGMPFIRVSDLIDVPFRCSDRQHEDWHLGYDMQQLGKLQMMNLTARFGHILTDEKHVVWPSDNEDLHVITPLREVRI